MVANDYIDSGRQSPSLFGRLRGEPETHYFWITAEGQAFLRADEIASKASNEGPSGEIASTPDDIKRVENSLHQLGYDITPYGAGVALLSLESGYNNIETASHLALATLARDAKEAGYDIGKLMALVPHARAMIDILLELKNAGLMREELFKNDAMAMLKVVVVDKEQPAWIERSDPVISQDRVANSRINYSQITA